LLGIRELLLKHPTELKLHKLAIIEKLRERISDDDKVVRETLYQLFKSVILPGCKEVSFVWLLLDCLELHLISFFGISVAFLASLQFDNGLQSYTS